MHCNVPLLISFDVGTLYGISEEFNSRLSLVALEDGNLAESAKTSPERFFAQMYCPLDRVFPKREAELGQMIGKSVSDDLDGV